MGGIQYLPVKIGLNVLESKVKDLKPGDAVRFLGIDTGKLHVVANNPATKLIAIKEDGSTYWSGISARRYSPPEIMILDHDGNVMLRWGLGRKKKEAHDGKN